SHMCDHHLLLPSSSFFFSHSGHHRDLHSFPTRRSSDFSRQRRTLDGEFFHLLAAIGNPLGHFIQSKQAEEALRHSEEWMRRILEDRKSTRLNSSHRTISYAVFCLKKKTKEYIDCTTTHT